MRLAQGPQHSDAGEARTCGPSVSSQVLYPLSHCTPIHLLILNLCKQLGHRSGQTKCLVHSDGISEYFLKLGSGQSWHGRNWYRMTAVSESSRQLTPKKEAPGDHAWDLPCMQLASYLEGCSLMWMMPLHLHVNKKSDYDLWYMISDFFTCAHNCLWDANFIFQSVPGCNGIADLS